MEQEKKKKVRKGLKITGITLGSILGVVVLTAASYVTYVAAQYYRIEDNQQLEITHNGKGDVELNKELTYTSSNIGFGAYDNEFSFFMDYGTEADGTVKYGTSSKPKTKEITLRNTLGSINTVKALDSDFVAFQEVDTKSDRAHGVNQSEVISNNMPGYDETFAINYHSAYLAYPINSPIGASTSGLKTLSKYKITSSVRKSFVISTAFLDKIVDLDRCFSVNYINVKNSDKQLVLVNSHMSAYDEGGTIRNKQIEQLNTFMSAELDKGNYVVVGGDFNHDLLTYNPLYDFNETDKIPYRDRFNQQVPSWYCRLFDENKECGFDDRFSIHAASDNPTYRGCDDAYRPGITYLSTLDGFIVSNNVEVVKTTTTNAKSDASDAFSFSDHQPTTLTFKLK